MRKVLLLIAVLLSGVSAMAKSAYIPKYRTYIHIVDGSDTIVIANYLKDLELKDSRSMFNIAVEHEEVTKEKVKSIKRAKRAANLAAFSAVMSGASTAFSQNSLQYMVRSTNTRIASQLADIYSLNANAEQLLNIDALIENTSSEELIVNDMERGLTWYVRPSQSLKIKLNNPEVTNLRISDVHNNQVRYAMVTAGSVAEQWDIEWEDDSCWIVIIYKVKYSDNKKIAHYKRISKEDYTEMDMTKEEYRAFKNQLKNK